MISNDLPRGYINVTFRDTNTNLVRYSYSNYLGFYSRDLPSGTYEVTSYVNNYYNSAYNIACPSSSVFITLDSLNNTDTLDFFIEPNNPIDLELNYYLGVIRPGFYFQNQIWYRNVGSSPMTGTVVMNYDPLLVPSTNNSGVVDTLNKTITWTFNNLAPIGINQVIYPYFDNLDVSVALGTQICNTLTIYPDTSDATPLNNTKTVCRTVVGSYDPNQKLVNPEGEIFEEVKTHDYHIDFQNLGTYEATFVIVRDNLDDNLDITTMRKYFLLRIIFVFKR